MSADLTTVIVNWNTAHLLDDCLRSVLAATPAGVGNEVVVVDNASSDGSVAHLRRCWQQVRVLVNERNEGFCRANNRALRETSAPLVLLVNTDARLAPDTIGVLLQRLDDDPRAGVVAPRLTYADGSFQRWTAGRDVDLRSAAAYLLMADRVAPRRSGGMYLGADTAVAFRPDWVSSAVMALRRRALDEVGLLDEDIFVYMDDVDLCRRLRARGWHVWYEPRTTAVHFMGGSSERDPGAASRAALRGLNHWFAGVHGRPAAQALRGLEVLGFGARAALYGTAAAARPSSTARAHARAHVTHLRQALEPLDD